MADLDDQLRTKLGEHSNWPIVGYVAGVVVMNPENPAEQPIHIVIPDGQTYYQSLGIVHAVGNLYDHARYIERDTQ